MWALLKILPFLRPSCQPKLLVANTLRWTECVPVASLVPHGPPRPKPLGTVGFCLGTEAVIFQVDEMMLESLCTCSWRTLESSKTCTYVYIYIYIVICPCIIYQWVHIFFNVLLVSSPYVLEILDIHIIYIYIYIYMCVWSYTYIYIHTYIHTLHYITLHYTTLHYITLHNIHSSLPPLSQRYAHHTFLNGMRKGLCFMLPSLWPDSIVRSSFMLGPFEPACQMVMDGSITFPLPHVVMREIKMEE